MVFTQGGVSWNQYHSPWLESVHKAQISHFFCSRDILVSIMLVVCTITKKSHEWLGPPKFKTRKLTWKKYYFSEGGWKAWRTLGWRISKVSYSYDGQFSGKSLTRKEHYMFKTRSKSMTGICEKRISCQIYHIPLMNR